MPHCDEYPFLSTQQGGGDARPQPNLQYIIGTQNSKQGTRLNQFYSAVQPTSEGINGCNITYETPFLAIPVPDFFDVDTTWACNGRNDS
jgi:Deoxyribonuclease NucA/NucB